MKYMKNRPKALMIFLEQQYQSESILNRNLAESAGGSLGVPYGMGGLLASPRSELESSDSKITCFSIQHGGTGKCRSLGTSFFTCTSLSS